MSLLNKFKAQFVKDLTTLIPEALEGNKPHKVNYVKELMECVQNSPFNYRT